MRNILNNLYHMNATNKHVANADAHADLYVIKFWIL